MKSNTRFRMAGIGALFMCWVGLYTFGTEEKIVSGTLSEPALNQSQDISLDQEIRHTIDALLVQALDLTEERAQRLLNTLHEARRMHQEYQHQRGRIEGQLEALLQVAQPDQAKIQQALQELETTKTQYHQQMLLADQTLGSFLSVEEQAKYILFQRHFTQQLHEMIAKIRQARLTQPMSNQSNFLLRRQDEESVIRQPR